jgi:hypothetical protein
MLYDKLNAEMKATVDAWVGRLKVLDWSRRSDLLTESALSFAQDLPPDKAKIAARGFITAVLERLGAGADGDEEAGEVTDTRQALLYLASLDLGHQALAQEYLDANPEIRAEVEKGLGDED